MVSSRLLTYFLLPVLTGASSSLTSSRLRRESSLKSMARRMLESAPRMSAAIASSRARDTASSGWRQISSCIGCRRRSPASQRRSRAASSTWLLRWCAARRSGSRFKALHGSSNLRACQGGDLRYFLQKLLPAVIRRIDRDRLALAPTENEHRAMRNREGLDRR